MIPESLKQITENLRKHIWIQKMASNAEIYVVGGSVRDAYLEKPMKDIDLIVDGLSVSGILKILREYGRANVEGESFSVIKFKPKGHVGEDYDVAVPREDRKIGSGHKGFEVVTDGVDVHGDLKRRDFTLNSMAVNIMSDELLDPFNGLKDLHNRLLKATDKNAFIEDPLRILRGIQFAARFRFNIEKGTMDLMKKNSHLIKEIAGERIYDEFQKILNKGGSTQMAINLLHETGADEALFNKKMLHYDKGFDDLDPISFYYMMGLVGGVDPYTFYMKKIKGSDKQKVGTAILKLDNILRDWDNLGETDQMYLTLQTMSKLPIMSNVVLLPTDMANIILDMNAGKIPSSNSDILINGDEIMELFGISSKKDLPKIGQILEKIRKAALENVFDWKSKTDTFNYVSNINI